ERLGARVEVDEDERPPRVDRGRDEAELRLREVRLLLAPRRGAEAAVEPVRPRVVRALQRLARPFSLGDDGAAMAADVEERAEDAVAVARDDDRRAAGAGCEEAGLRELPEVAGVLPRAAEDPLLLAPQDLRVRVPAIRKRLFH